MNASAPVRRDEHGSHPLRYRAGPRVFERLRREGLKPERVRALVGPASGPRWLVLAGLDRTLMDSGLAAEPTTGGAGRQGARRLLVGASAGTWRMLSMACRNPQAAHARLVDGYVNQVFPPRVRPTVVSAAYRRMLADVFSEGAGHAFGNGGTDVACHVTRLRGGLPWKRRTTQAAALILGLVLHRAGFRSGAGITRRVLLHSNPESFTTIFAGTVVALDDGNIIDAALASGTIPVHMEPVRDIAGAPAGWYVDGGFGDYHLRQTYLPPGEGVTLFPHYQREIVPEWFDRGQARRGPAFEALADVLQLYPSDAFLAGLPDGRVPDVAAALTRPTRTGAVPVTARK